MNRWQGGEWTSPLSSLSVLELLPDLLQVLLLEGAPTDPILLGAVLAIRVQERCLWHTLLITGSGAR